MNYPMSAPEMAAVAPAGDAVQSMPARSHRFARLGQRPLVFNGSMLAMAMSFSPEIPYWYEINIYRTDSGQFALVLKHFFQSQDEQDYVQSWMFDDLEAAFAALENYDAAADVRVHGEKLTDMAPAELAAHAYALQAQVASRRAHWASLVGELLSEVEEVSKAMA